MLAITRRLGLPALFLAGMLTGAVITRPALAMPQPHMRTALADLQAALSQLLVAEHNKGGWRDRAINETREAINDTRVGIAYGNRR